MRTYNDLWYKYQRKCRVYTSVQRDDHRLGGSIGPKSECMDNGKNMKGRARRPEF